MIKSNTPKDLLREIERKFYLYFKARATKPKTKYWVELEEFLEAVKDDIEDTDFGVPVIGGHRKKPLSPGSEANPLLTVTPEGLNVTRIRKSDSFTKPHSWERRADFLDKVKGSPIFPALRKAGVIKNKIYHRMEFIPGAHGLKTSKMTRDGVIAQAMRLLAEFYGPNKVRITDVNKRNVVCDLRNDNLVIVDFLLKKR